MGQEQPSSPLSRSVGLPSVRRAVRRLGISALGTVVLLGAPVAVALPAAAASPAGSRSPVDFIRYADAITPNDPSFGAQQPYLEAIHVPEAWSTTEGSNAVTVAVVDSGVDGTNPDLAGRLVPGCSFVDDQQSEAAVENGAEPVCDNPISPTEDSDDVGHGTMVAGIIGAATDNGVAVAGVDWNARIMPVAAIGPDGSANDADIIAGIRWATDNGAEVINLSLGGCQDDPALDDAIAYAQHRNIVVVAAAGNEGGEPRSQLQAEGCPYSVYAGQPDYPAATPGVLSVGATGVENSTTGWDTLAFFSNYGPWVSVLAPGVGITSTGNVGNAGGCLTDAEAQAQGAEFTGCAVQSGDGTSFSAPLVAGVVSLLRSQYPAASATTIISDIESTTRAVPALAGDAAHGVVDASAALAGLAGSGTTAGSGPGTGAGNIAPAPGGGYWMLGSDGRVYAFGDAGSYGDPAGQLGGATAAALAATPTGRGYWVVDSAGAVFTFGDAGQFGDAGSLAPGEIVTGISPSHDGAGYWVFTSRGRVIARGDAPFAGDMSAVALNGPVLGGIPTPSGRGYYLVASDGGIFAFGDAVFYGSEGGHRLNAPVRSLVPTLNGGGYWLVASDGGVFSFGDAAFHGSMGATRLNAPVTGMVAFGDGYLMVATDGGVFDFSDRTFLGSLADHPPAHPVVAITATP